MRKRKINQQYLRHITSQQTNESEIDSFEFADSIRSFAEEYLYGIMTVSISGASMGYTKLNLPVASYLVRLLGELGEDDEEICLEISLSDELMMRASYRRLAPTEDVAYIIKVARLAGFEVSREGESLTFKSEVNITQVLRIYATSGEDFREMLVVTHNM